MQPRHQMFHWLGWLWNEMICRQDYRGTKRPPRDQDLPKNSAWLPIIVPAHFLSFPVDDTENLIEPCIYFQHIAGTARNPFKGYKRRVSLAESAHKFNAAITHDGDWSNGTDNVSTLYLYGTPLLTAKC